MKENVILIFQSLTYFIYYENFHFPAENFILLKPFKNFMCMCVGQLLWVQVPTEAKIPELLESLTSWSIISTLPSDGSEFQVLQ